MGNRPRLFAVIAIMVTTLAMGFFYASYIQRTKEAQLKEALRTMREAIENYTTYEQQAPQSLEDLVRANYLFEIPRDPVCTEMDWNLHFGERNLILGLELKKVKGLDNVFSGCPKVGSDRKPYNTW